MYDSGRWTSVMSLNVVTQLSLAALRTAASGGIDIDRNYITTLLGKQCL